MEATTFLTLNKTQIQDILMGNIHFAIQCAFEEKLLVHFEYTNLKGIPRPSDAATVLVDKVLYRGETVCKTFLRLLQDSKMTDVFPGLRTLSWNSPTTPTAPPPAPSTTPTAPPPAPSTTYASRPEVAQISSQQPRSISTQSAHSITTQSASQSACSISTQSARSITTQPAAKSGDTAKHFVDHHRVSLIQRVSMVDPILDRLLEDDFISNEGYSTVRSKKTRMDKMRELYRLLNCGGPRAKDAFYRYLQENDRYLLQDLRQNDPSGPSGDEGTWGRRETPSAQPRVAAHVPAGQSAAASVREHFVDKHRYGLIHGVTTVDYILDLLLSSKGISEYGYEQVMTSRTRTEKMRELYTYMNSTRAKDAFYSALQRSEPTLVRELNH